MKRHVLVALVVLLALGFGFVLGSPLLAFVSVDPDTKTYCAPVGNIKGGGQFPENELIEDGTTYMTWDERGVSMPITMSSAAERCNVGQVFPYAAHRYVFYIDPGSGEKFASQDDFPGGLIEVQGFPSPGLGKVGLSSRTVRIDGLSFVDVKTGSEVGIPDGSRLRVWLQAKICPLGQGCYYANIAKDETRLLRATPDVTRGADTFDLADGTGFFTWSIPFTELDGNPAYYLRLSTYKGVVGGWDDKPLTAKTGRAEFSVASVLGSDKSVAVRAEIYSPIFRADVTDVTTVDDKDLAPKVTSVTLNQDEFREGDSVKVAFAASPNPETASPIDKYHVLAHIGGEAQYDSYTTATSVNFIASETGVLEVEVYAVDKAGRMSPVYEVEATVGNVIVDCEVHPELPECGGGGGGFPWLVVIGLALFVVSFAMARVAPGPWRFLAYLLMFAGIALLALGIWEVVT